MVEGNDPPIDESPPKPEELPLLAKDLLYEMDRFKLAVLRVHQRIDHDAWVEVLGVHTRNLVSFLRSKRLREDDLIAVDYVPEWDAVIDGGEELEWLEESWQSMNKRLFHLTAYRRRVPKENDARLVALFDSHMSAVVGRFLDKLPAERRPWFGLKEG